MNLPKYGQMVNAMRESDPSYDGKFYVGVLTTGIYCLPSCKAKLPKLENVVFFSTREEAIAAGLRGCKRCKSERYPDVLPEWLPAVINFMKTRRGEKLNENLLMDMTGTNISTVRRYFKIHLDSTPLAFHRKIRLKYARELLEDGKDYLTACFESGFESFSGFRDAFLKEFGTSPGEIHADR